MAAHLVKPLSLGHGNQGDVVEIEERNRIETTKAPITATMRTESFLIGFVLSEVWSASPNDNHGFPADDTNSLVLNPAIAIAVVVSHEANAVSTILSR